MLSFFELPLGVLSQPDRSAMSAASLLTISLHLSKNSIAHLSKNSIASEAKAETWENPSSPPPDSILVERVEGIVLTVTRPECLALFVISGVKWQLYLRAHHSACCRDCEPLFQLVGPTESRLQPPRPPRGRLPLHPQPSLSPACPPGCYSSTTGTYVAYCALGHRAYHI